MKYNDNNNDVLWRNIVHYRILMQSLSIRMPSNPSKHALNL